MVVLLDKKCMVPALIPTLTGIVSMGFGSMVPGNPVKMSRTAEGPETRVPWLGEHTDEVLAAELGLDADRLAELRSRGVVS